MAKGKTKKQAAESTEAESPAASPSATPKSNPPPPTVTSPYDKEPNAGGGALVFLAIVGVLLALAIVVGFLQGQ